ncbi:MAG TPA: hypothetical protein VFX15_10420 [Actinomycetes bacterium]|nr:hypothetical protein [Actinomycetes bacterium]
MAEAAIEGVSPSDDTDDVVTFVVVAGVGALLGLVVELLYRRFLSEAAASFGQCGTFAECSQGEFEFLAAVLLASVLLPVLTWPVLRFGRALLLVIAGPFVYVPLAIVLIGRFGFGPWTLLHSILFIAGSAGVLLLEALVMRRGSQWPARLGVFAGLVVWVIAFATLLGP